jgi:hypothetical protein
MIRRIHFQDSAVRIAQGRATKQSTEYLIDLGLQEENVEFETLQQSFSAQVMHAQATLRTLSLGPKEVYPLAGPLFCPL